MSGRDAEPIAAFFPAIDRNLMRDLDRHLRGAAPQAAAEPQQQTRPTAQTGMSQLPRPSTSDVLEAVHQAASSLASMGQRIQELESRQVELEGVNTQLREKLGEMLHLQQETDARARAEAERAARGEEIASQHLARAQALEADLETALADLHRIAEAITGTLAVQPQR